MGGKAPSLYTTNDGGVNEVWGAEEYLARVYSLNESSRSKSLSAVVCLFVGIFYIAGGALNRIAAADLPLGSELQQQQQALRAQKGERSSDPASLVLLADLYLHLGDDVSLDTSKRRALYEEGTKLSRQAMELQEQMADHHYLYAANLGSASRLTGVMASALTIQELKRHVKRALELNPAHAPALHMMGMMLEELPWFLGGDAESALLYLRRAVVADPGYVHARLDLARAYAKRKDPRSARGGTRDHLAPAAPVRCLCEQ